MRRHVHANSREELLTAVAAPMDYADIVDVVWFMPQEGDHHVKVVRHPYRQAMIVDGRQPGLAAETDHSVKLDYQSVDELDEWMRGWGL